MCLCRFILASLRRGLLSFLVGVSFLVLAACAGGDGSSSDADPPSSPRAFEVELTFAPISGGFQIGNQSDFGDLVSLNITATNDNELIWQVVPIAAFSRDNYNFTRLDDQSNYTFLIRGTFDDGRKEEVRIIFIWDENDEDHNNRGIRPGLNTDGDGRADSADADDDNDGALDDVDNCPLVVNPQQNNTDEAEDGGDACDEDDDNDGLDDTDVIEQQRNSAGKSCSRLADCDEDGALDDVDNCPLVVNPQQNNTDGAEDGGDACDEDDDNDGLDDNNTIEQQRNSAGKSCSRLADCDGDGALDDEDNCPLIVNPQQNNTDGAKDGGDACDEDDDNDGLDDTDVIEQQKNLAGKSCSLLADCDNDGALDDVDNCPLVVNPQQNNTDGAEDGGDACDEDDDNDGLDDTDVIEQQNNLAGKSCSLLADCDNDGALDDVDNCPLIINPQQNNTDEAEDGGDACDEDDDNDEILDDMDNCPLVVNPQQNNTDEAKDGGDACDEDDDNDGVLDGVDNCPLVVNPQQNNTDEAKDGGDACDEDDDNDGLADTDVIEQQRNSAGKSCSLLADCDGDGVQDGDEAVGCVLKPDCDSDGVGDDADSCSAGEMGWVSNSMTDNDGDGCRDAGEDIDDDGDRLIELGTGAELNGVRYVLDGTGRQLSADGELNTSGCGDGAGSCNGYELITNISLAAYSDGEGWQPLGSDTDDGCRGVPFSGVFEGNGRTISDLSINRPNQDCVGLFGHVAERTEIRNLTLQVEQMIGGHRTGSLVGSGVSARVLSSSVVVGNLSGDNDVGGLVGYGFGATIISSSVVVGNLSGSERVGGLVGLGIGARVLSSSVVVGNLSGGNRVGGLVGDASSARILSSSVVAAEVRGSNNLGGLIGDGSFAQIFSSSAVVDELSGNSRVGGMVGRGDTFFGFTEIFSSSTVVGKLRGSSRVGGLVGTFSSNSQIAYSYVVSGSNTPMLVGSGSGTGVDSYWDSDTSGTTSGNHGEAKTSIELRMPTDYEGIYATWDNGTRTVGATGVDNITIYCDKDNSLDIEADERDPNNLIWDFGSSNDYPAIRCTPLAPDEWRSWWFLNRTNQPQLNQTRLDNLLPSP